MAERRRGLGRGIGALIPDSQNASKDRPIDIFFGSEASAASPSSSKDEDAVAEKGGVSDAGMDSDTSSIGSRTKQSAPVGEAPAESAKSAPKSGGKAVKKGQTTADRATPGGAAKDPKKSAMDRSSTADKKTANRAVSSPIDSPDGEQQRNQEEDSGLVPVPGATYAELPLGSIVPNQRQPRSVFDDDELNELAASIKEVGILQPIIVRPIHEKPKDHPDAAFELIMGERRWRASQKAGETSIPAIVRGTEDEDLLRDALLENLHRTELNPLEEAAAYQQLLEDFHCTQEELAKRIARSRPQITNTLRLMKLPPLVQRRVAAHVLSAGHARALLGLADPAAMERLAQRIVAEGLSVRQVEEIVAMGEDSGPAQPARKRTQRFAPELNELSGELADRFDTKVKVNMGSRKGSIKIDFASIDDLNRILEVMAPEMNAVNVTEQPKSE